MGSTDNNYRIPTSHLITCEKKKLNPVPAAPKMDKVAAGFFEGGFTLVFCFFLSSIDFYVGKLAFDIEIIKSGLKL